VMPITTATTNATKNCGSSRSRNRGEPTAHPPGSAPAFAQLAARPPVAAPTYHDAAGNPTTAPARQIATTTYRGNALSIDL
jgi:hypothetical protein